MITMTEARHVQLGDTLSTDGGIVRSKTYNSARNTYHFIIAAEDWEWTKDAHINANDQLPIWREDAAMA